MIDAATNGQPAPDDVALAVASSLEADAKSWNVDTTDKVLSRGAGENQMIVTVGEGAADVTVRMPTAGAHYRTAGTHGGKGVANESQDHIWKAYKAWQTKRMVTRLGWNPPPPPPEPEVIEPPKRTTFECVMTWLTNDKTAGAKV
jgi:hypothetical protein